MLRIVIFGATSGIAEAAARAFAKDGARFFLVARNATALSDIAADLRARGAGEVAMRVADLGDMSMLAGLCEAAKAALGGIDVALIAHGVLPDQAACEASAGATEEVFRINTQSPVLLMTELGAMFAEQGSGALVVLSSVAGDRGRPSNYVYGASKAALTVMGEGMAMKLKSRGVNVLVVEPGFVDTKMTAGFKKGALWASAQSVGEGIAAAVKAGRSGVLYLPFWWRFIMPIVKHAPGALVRRM